jgi:hypothetical protein
MTRREFRVSSTKRLHGLVIAGVFAVVGIGALVAAGTALPDGEMVGAVNLALAIGIALYVLRTTGNPGVGMVLDDDGIWFRDWNLPPVPWRHIAGVRIAGIRIRTLVYIELVDAEAFFAHVDESSQTPRSTNPLVRDSRLMVPNGALDAPLTDVVAAIREACENNGNVIAD